MDNKRIKIFDTTLRDGEQAPGCTMNLQEKLQVARTLERLKVDVIEAGFAIASRGDFESVSAIAREVRECTVASLARAGAEDIDTAWEAVRHAADPRIHVFIATSPIHMEYKLRMKPEQVLEQTSAMVARARRYCPSVEFSCEDATRSEWPFMAKVVEAAIKAGATVINLPDTVGYTTPAEMRALIEYMMTNVEKADEVEFSVHCHNDLGMAVANSLAGVLGGARQIECTINGLGERAGNTAMEEVVMALHTRADAFPGLSTGIDISQIARASKTVYDIIGQKAPMNKPIVGRNAFAHESGVHQHGVLANKQTYEIMTPESIGIRANNLVLGKHSGKHAFESHLKEMGYVLDAEELKVCFAAFKDLCDKKKVVTDEDIEALLAHRSLGEEHTDGYELDWFAVHTTNFTTATATICLKKGEETFEAVALGDGPIDAAFKAVDDIIKPIEHTFDIYNINSVSEGKDTLGNVTVKLNANDRSFIGRGLSTDIFEASIVAYLNAINRLQKNAPEKEEN